ncbi:SusD/RagB family nutrient-binding outer membrane lipoprotein [Bacteroides sp.]|uniref:SusD/RagB family nutrient-binding outer membrane lipoprotein n=1 Tax=Bacteroides sp. TaxID=29523 RepID=UPI002624491A|nr:SusD/RagB family nutrient-binding outer membrane lipoprotein [Bacteroides sp.]
MKLFKSMILCSAGALMTLFSGCSDWLDVNVDPENPTAENATYDSRLAHIEFYTNSATQFAAWRSSMSMGDWTRYYDGGAYWSMSYWSPQTGAVTTSYQWWFCGAAVNIPFLIDKATAAEAWHYVGAARVIRAYGFMLMTDLYGEMPYKSSEAEAGVTPTYNDGKTIYLGCLTDLDIAIEMFQKEQGSATAALAVGDIWNGGSVDKWLKLAYLLKARYINKLIKKGAGSYLEGKYDATEILACLDKAQQSNADNTVFNHIDANNSHDVLGWDEPVDYSPLFSVCGMNAGYMPTKMLYDNLTNFAGNGTEDPRADKILPWAYSKQSSNSPAGVKFKDGWRRSMGVDMISNDTPSLTGGPLRSNFSAAKSWWIDSESPTRKGDTIYVECTTQCKAYQGRPDLLYRRDGTDASRESGSFYTRVSSPTYIGTYAEACFIRAEVLFNQGNKGAAFDAYKKGIVASIDGMNDKLKVWCREDANLEACPSFSPMTQADIDNYLSNGIGTKENLTLGKILTQKRLALHFSVEIWNDMRRYDFNPELFLGWNIPARYGVDATAQKGIPQGKQFRRWQQCSHELNYNTANLQAIGVTVPGADTSIALWNAAEDVWTLPVWWDSAQN